jgi:DNA-binding IclR family transcriptional regulator
MKSGTPTATTFLNTLANGLNVVETMVGRKLSLRELADEVVLPRQTTYRILHTLIEVRWVDRDADNLYFLSPRLWSLGVRSFGLNDLQRVMSPVVRRLAAEYGETVHLAIYRRGSVIYIQKEDGSHPIRSYTELGGQAPAYCVATGKALLAHQTSAEIEEVVYRTDLVAFTPQTVTDPGTLEKELDEVRSLGYALNRGEWREGVGGVAVPIFSPTGEVLAGLGFSGPIDRILARQEQLTAALREAARIEGAGPAD